MNLQQLGPLRAEVTYGEGGKFTAPLLLVHGLWSTGSIWRPFAGYLSHRGWSCYALVLNRTEGERAGDLEARIADLRAAIAALEAPPVIVGHDLGAALALHCADAARALVMVAPLILPPLASEVPPVLRQGGGPLERLFRSPLLRPPRGRWQSAYGPGGARESALLLRRLVEQPFPQTSVPLSVPGLVMAGESDPVTSVAAAQALASIGAEVEVVPGGHALPVDAGWEERVARVHRWLIKKLGAGLLALYEEAIADREG